MDEKNGWMWMDEGRMDTRKDGLINKWMVKKN